MPNILVLRSCRKELAHVEHEEFGGPKCVLATRHHSQEKTNAQKRDPVDLWTVGYADTRLTAQARFPMDKPWKTR